MKGRPAKMLGDSYSFYLSKEERPMFLAVKNYLEGTDGIRRTIATVVRDMTCIFYQNIKKRETNEPN